MPPAHIFTKTVAISAQPSKVWHTLTSPALMKQWMSETEIEVVTNWVVGSPILIRGPWYKHGFENTGTVLAFEPDRSLSYTHLSSLSRLPNEPENYTVIDFRLAPVHNLTLLTLTLSNFPTDVIYKHLAFYWNVTLELLKKFTQDA